MLYHHAKTHLPNYRFIGIDISFIFDHGGYWFHDKEEEVSILFSNNTNLCDIEISIINHFNNSFTRLFNTISQMIHNINCPQKDIQEFKDIHKRVSICMAQI
jgi:hypothetical protein